MTYLRTTNPRNHSGNRFERRIDDRTADDIGDALRADSTQAAALAMQHLQVDVQVALRVLAGTKDEPGRGLRRRERAESTTA